MGTKTLLIVLFSFYVVSSVVAQEEIDYDERNGLFANFDDDTYEWFTWDCADPIVAEFFVDENPDRSGINTSDSVGIFLTSTCTYEGVACNARFKPIDFSEKTIFKVKVWPPDTGFSFLFKIEDFDNNTIFHEVEAKTTKIEEWEELSFDFSGAASNTYHRIALFPDFGADNEYEWYFDDIRLGSEDGSKVSTSHNIITRYQLMQNYPNPFNPNTKISYSLPHSNDVVLKVYDMLGKEIKTLVDAYQTVGTYEVTFNAGELSSGVYLYKLEAGKHFVETKKMLLVR